MAESAATRRDFLRRTSIGSAALVMPVLAVAQEKAAPDKDKPKGDEGISPAEDLMREHGVLNRILLIYEEGIRRIHQRRALPPEALRSAAGIRRSPSR